jgi:hypothetical protein
MTDGLKQDAAEVARAAARRFLAGEHRTLVRRMDRHPQKSPLSAASGPIGSTGGLSTASPAAFGSPTFAAIQARARASASGPSNL